MGRLLYKYDDLTYEEVCKIFVDFIDCEVKVTNSASCDVFRCVDGLGFSDYRDVYIESLESTPISCNLICGNGWCVEIFDKKEGEK